MLQNQIVCQFFFILQLLDVPEEFDDKWVSDEKALFQICIFKKVTNVEKWVKGTMFSLFIRICVEKENCVIIYKMRP